MNQKYYLECECTSEMIRFDFDKDDDILMLSVYRDAFYTESLTSFDKFKLWCKRVWLSVQSKEYLLYDMVLNKEEILKFKEWINSLEI